MEKVFFKVDSNPHTINDINTIADRSGLLKYSIAKLLVRIGAIDGSGHIKNAYRDVFFYYGGYNARSINPSDNFTIEQVGLTEKDAYKIVCKMLAYVVKYPGRCLK